MQIYYTSIMPLKLGDKIKALRRVRGLSQFDMETDLGLGYGSISRIESGQITPTRNSLIRFSDYFNLDDREMDYLIGSRSEVPTGEEIESIISKTKNIWSDESALVLLRDDRFRLCEASKGFKMAVNVSESLWRQSYYLRNIVSIVLDVKLPFAKGFDCMINPNAEKELKSIIYAFYHETKSMEGEEDFQKVLEDISNNPLAKKIWDEIIASKNHDLYLLIKNKQISLIIGDRNLNLAFYTEGIPESPKFSYIEFFPYQRNA